MVLEKAKRLVEHKKGRHHPARLDHAVARAYNTLAPHSGKNPVGGVDANALHKPKDSWVGAQCREGGSLTIIATALVDTGSRMDEVIFEEFQGTGNMELCLDRHLRRPNASSRRSTSSGARTRRKSSVSPRRTRAHLHPAQGAGGVPPVEAMELITEKLKKTRSQR